MITWILLGGALSGAGVLMLVLILAPPAVQPAAALAELDSQRDERRLRQEARRLNPRERALPDWLDALGYRAAALLRRTGIDLGALTSDLSVLGRSLERHLVTSLLLGLLGFIASHAFGQGSVIWVFISEIFPNRVRARGQSLGSLTHWVFAFITTYAFPVLTDKLGGGYAFGIFFLAMVGQLFWVLKVMPETKGIPLEEMEEKLGLTND